MGTHLPQGSKKRKEMSLSSLMDVTACVGGLEEAGLLSG